MSKRFSTLLLAVAVLAVMSRAAEPPAWAYPVLMAAGPRAPDDGQARHVPDSEVVYTLTQIAAIGGRVPDWHPEEHPPMPDIVAKGRPPQVFACAYCHLPTGAGRPENASLAGLTAAYIKQEMLAFKNGDRPGSERRRVPQTVMIAIAKAVTPAEIEEAAAYFASLKPASFVKVIEAATVPKTVVAGWTLTPALDGGTEPIGNRIVEMPEDFARFEHRDSRTPYLAYVPVGSVQRGADLVATGGNGRTLLCVTCHGPELKGLADVPRLAGRSPSFLMRQLYDLRSGVRKGGASELMKPVVAKLSDEDLVDIVAYIASRAP
jgi:cytochrome c553